VQLHPPVLQRFAVACVAVLPVTHHANSCGFRFAPVQRRLHHRDRRVEFFRRDGR